jgi:hypothetical protein
MPDAAADPAAVENPNNLAAEADAEVEAEVEAEAEETAASEAPSGPSASLSELRRSWQDGKDIVEPTYFTRRAASDEGWVTPKAEARPIPETAPETVASDADADVGDTGPEEADRDNAPEVAPDKAEPAVEALAAAAEDVLPDTPDPQASDDATAQFLKDLVAKMASDPEEAAAADAAPELEATADNDHQDLAGQPAEAASGEAEPAEGEAEPDVAETEDEAEPDEAETDEPLKRAVLGLIGSADNGLSAPADAAAAEVTDPLTNDDADVAGVAAPDRDADMTAASQTFDTDPETTEAAVPEEAPVAGETSVARTESPDFAGSTRSEDAMQSADQDDLTDEGNSDQAMPIDEEQDQKPEVAEATGAPAADATAATDAADEAEAEAAEHAGPAEVETEDATPDPAKAPQDAAEPTQQPAARPAPVDRGSRRYDEVTQRRSDWQDYDDSRAGAGADGFAAVAVEPPRASVTVAEMLARRRQQLKADRNTGN